MEALLTNSFSHYLLTLNFLVFEVAYINCRVAPNPDYDRLWKLQLEPSCNAVVEVYRLVTFGIHAHDRVISEFVLQ